MPRTDPATTFTCGTCGTTYGEAAWRLLRVAERIEAPRVRRLVSRWPEGHFVEVRDCRSCGKTIAAKRVLGA
jgi:ribosomal protein S27E